MLCDMDQMPTLARIRTFDQPGPRYTSYPTADHFSDGFDASRQAWWLKDRALRQPGKPVTVYVHIPFCESICHYCACNRIGTRDFSRAGHYLETLQQEIRLYASHLQKDVRISQLHLGGGTPTFLSDEQLATLLRTLDDTFGFCNDAERSIEVDPRTVDARRLENIRTMGFDRVSFGVQDLDPAVQQAIHRIQPESMIEAMMTEAHRLGFRSINIDLVYGLPRQTLASLAHTLDRIVQLRPGRMAIYGYAHLPSRFKAQRLIRTEDLPDQTLRMQMVHLAISKLNEYGYKHIGMDHFALADDDLAVALTEGRLRRNFMGYTAMPGDDLIGLGVSSISAIGGAYSQNHRELKAWRQAIETGQLATARGIELQGDDHVQREVIMELMCQGRIDFAAFGQRFGIDAHTYFQPEIAGLQRFIAAGLVIQQPDGIRVSDEGRYFLRSIAMIFDRHAQRRRQAQVQAQTQTQAHQADDPSLLPGHLASHSACPSSSLHASTTVMPMTRFPLPSTRRPEPGEAKR